MKGLGVPIRVEAGGLAVCAGEEQLRNIILLSLSLCESENPFQDLGIGADLVFDNDTEAVRGRIRGRVSSLFRRLEREGRARLVLGYPIFAREDDGLVVQLRYINLETTEEAELELLYGSATFAGGR